MIDTRIVVTPRREKVLIVSKGQNSALYDAENILYVELGSHYVNGGYTVKIP